MLVIGRKHGQLQSSITLHRSKWKWFKLYVNFEFCGGKNHLHSKKHIDLQSQVICVDKKFFKKSIHILEDNVSSVQVDLLNT